MLQIYIKTKKKTIKEYLINNKRKNDELSFMLKKVENLSFGRLLTNKNIKLSHQSI